MIDYKELKEKERKKELISPVQLAELVGISYSTLKLHRSMGKLMNGPHPRHYQITPKRSRYDMNDIREWSEKYGIRIIEEGESAD
jgi:predicted DNA-binding transcriptional regulator AlpA